MCHDKRPINGGMRHKLHRPGRVTAGVLDICPKCPREKRHLGPSIDLRVQGIKGLRECFQGLK